MARKKREKAPVDVECLVAPRIGSVDDPKMAELETMYPVFDSPLGTSFDITSGDASGAKQCSESECVIARALWRKFGRGLVAISVGPRTTKVATVGKDGKGVIMRFRTSGKLERAVNVFDKTGNWELPPGTYRLNPYPPSENRHTKRGKAKKPQNKPMDVFKGNPIRARHITRVNKFATMGTV